jgi:hypothetical protein
VWIAPLCVCIPQVASTSAPSGGAGASAAPAPSAGIVTGPSPQSFIPYVVGLLTSDTRLTSLFEGLRRSQGTHALQALAMMRLCHRCTRLGGERWVWLIHSYRVLVAWDECAEGAVEWCAASGEVILEQGVEQEVGLSTVAAKESCFLRPAAFAPDRTGVGSGRSG